MYRRLVSEYRAIISSAPGSSGQQSSTAQGQPNTSGVDAGVPSADAPARCPLYRSLLKQYREAIAAAQAQAQVAEVAAAMAAVAPMAALEFTGPGGTLPLPLPMPIMAASAGGLTLVAGALESARAHARGVTEDAPGSASGGGVASVGERCGAALRSYRELLEEYRCILADRQAQEGMAQAMAVAVAVAPHAAMEFAPLCMPLSTPASMAMPGALSS